MGLSARSKLLVIGSLSLFPGLQAFTVRQSLTTATRLGNNEKRSSALKPLSVVQISDTVEKATAVPESVFDESVLTEQQIVVKPVDVSTTITPPTSDDADAVYRRGLATIALITVIFASNSPALHTAFTEVSQPPPVFLINAAVSVVAIAGMLLGGPLLDQNVEKPTLIQQDSNEFQKTTSSNNSIFRFFVGAENQVSLQAGMELGLWKTLGTLANIYGLSQTSAGHGAFLIQLTTLLVPLAQGVMGVPIPRQIWSAIALALGGVFLFTQDPGAVSATSIQGDLACALAAVFYATYDLRLFHWGKRVDPLELITSKIATQAALSFLALLMFASGETMDFFAAANGHDLAVVGMVTLWSGLMVNAIAPFLQVGGQQAVGPARAQVLYASQPLWAALMSFLFLGETVGPQGLIGGTAFLGAMMLAATADLPDPDCGKDNCEV